MLSEPKLGLVLSGGGARGAYEAGVLGFVFGALLPELGVEPRLIVTGTSVGAFNGAYLAAGAGHATGRTKQLMEAWSTIRLAEVLAFSVREAKSLHRLLLGGRGEIGLFSGETFGARLERTIDWPELHRAIDEGRVDTFAVTATHVSTGSSVVFADRGPRPPAATWPHPGLRVENARVSGVHLRASAAMPILLPPVLVGDDLYADGGLRLNSPISPALHLGADRLLVVALSEPSAMSAHVAPRRTPSLAFLVGKALDAMHLDHLERDLERLDQLNRLIDGGARVFGPDFAERMSAASATPLRRVERVVVRPAVDIGVLARDYLVEHRNKIDGRLGRLLFSATDVGEDHDADLASYLLFDGGFTRELVRRGFADAERQSGELTKLLSG